MKDLQIKKQIDVVRAGLDLLEKEAVRVKKIKRWKQAAKAVAENNKNKNNHRVNR